MNPNDVEVSVIDPKALDDLERLNRDATMAPWWIDRDAVESNGGPVVTAWAFNGDVELVIALRNDADNLIAEAREAARLREWVAELEAVVRGFVGNYRGVYHHDVDTGRLRVVDHACRRCVTEAHASDDMVSDDFACAYHRAVDVLPLEPR